MPGYKHTIVVLETEVKALKREFAAENKKNLKQIDDLLRKNNK